MYLDKSLELVSSTSQKRGVCQLVNVEENLLPLSHECAGMCNMYCLPSISYMPGPSSMTFTTWICGNPSLCSILCIINQWCAIHVINLTVDTDPIIDGVCTNADLLELRVSESDDSSMRRPLHGFVKPKGQ